jgi:TonB family protein
MTETVTDIIAARARTEDGLKTMIVWSVGLHVAVLGGLLLAPRATSDAPPVVMTISLSGSEGVRSEGMTQAGAQPVKEVAPPEEKPKPATPPRERAEMTLPDPKAKTTPRTKPQAVEAPSVTPTPAPAPTKVRGQGFGLSTAGGGGVGGVTLDISGNFCCQEYLNQMVVAIKTKWNDQQSVVGITGMKFTILKDGTITAVQIEKPSGFVALDNESRHALEATARLAPLPSAYPNSNLTVHLQFEYTR